MLDNVDYKAYVYRTIAFARTIVIKCEDIAKLENRRLREHYGVPVGTDKSKWRYYLNLNGEYHSTDTMMRVQSLDNGEEIDFTKSELELHPATKRAYRQGSYYYTRLVDLNPGQRDLINGIINPIPPSESIPAKNYQILRYNQDYVLWNEHQLIPELQAHIYNMVATSFDTEYLYTEDLMLPILYGNLYASIISACIQIREEAIGTRFAHEFHIWSRLASLGLSTVYKSVLDRKQTMWLYRNLDYVLKYQGRRKTFDELVEIVLSHRKVPLARYEALQTTESQLVDLYPSPKLISTPVNMVKEYGVSARLWTPAEVIAKEVPLALDNHRDTLVDEELAVFAIKNDLHSIAPTKVLESTMVDATDRNAHTLLKTLHNHWIYLTDKGYYLINHDFTDLRTGRHFRLNTKDAYILWCYLVDRYNGYSRETIPWYNYFDVRKETPPTYQELMKLGNERILTEEVTKAILGVSVRYERLVSPDRFFEKVKEVFDKRWDHTKFQSSVLNLFTHAQVSNAVDSLYETGVVSLTDKKTYQEFLLSHDLSFEDYGPEELLDLAWAIWKKVTGWENVNYISIAEQQRSLINLMKDLTSYTVQYIGSTDDTEGHYELGYQPLMDSDIWTNDGGTSIIHDDTNLVLPSIKHAVSENQLVNEAGPWNILGDGIGGFYVESIACATVPLNLNMCKIVEDPEPSPFMITQGMTLIPIDEE